MKKGKILFAGNFQYEFREPAMVKALQSLGWEVEKFSWWDYIPKSICGEIQNKYLFGPVIKKVNEVLIERCNSTKPDVVFIYKGIYVWPQTITRMKSCKRLVVSWNPDNPFGHYNADFAKRYKIRENMLLNKIMSYERAFYFGRLWINFIKTIPLYDVCFVYRRENIRKYQSVGAREVYLMPSFYVPELHHPVELTEEDQKRFESNVIFIGHF